MSSLTPLPPPGGISRSIRDAIQAVVDPEVPLGKSGIVMVRVDVEVANGLVIPRWVAAVKVGHAESLAGEWKFAVEGESPVNGKVSGRVSVEGKWTW